MPTFASQLKAWRGVDDSRDGRGDFTQEEAAAHLGIPLRTYQGYEAGARSPRGLALDVLQVRMKTKPHSQAKQILAATKAMVRAWDKKSPVSDSRRVNKTRTTRPAKSGRRPARRTGRKSKHETQTKNKKKS